MDEAGVVNKLENIMYQVSTIVGSWKVGSVNASDAISAIYISIKHVTMEDLVKGGCDEPSK